MIALQSNCLLFRLANGESIPCSAEMINFEVHGNLSGLLEPEMLHHATASVFHYFKNELSCETITVGEFACALEKVLRGLGFVIRAGAIEPFPRETIETDLGMLAGAPAESFELFFFQRLRNELRMQLRQSPRMVRFRGLRRCVKQLAGAHRWSRRCEKLQDQIVDYLRQCLTAEPEQNECALVVE
jgi:hypothetical protein